MKKRPKIVIVDYSSLDDLPTNSKRNIDFRGKYKITITDNKRKLPKFRDR